MFVLRVTLGTVIIFIILQLYSISITTPIVYCTLHDSSFFVSILHIRGHLLFAFLHRFAHTFPLSLQFRSTATFPFIFSVYINNLTLMATGCEDEFSVVLLLHHLPCSLPRSLPVARPRHRYINGQVTSLRTFFNTPMTTSPTSATLRQRPDHFPVIIR